MNTEAGKILRVPSALLLIAASGMAFPVMAGPAATTGASDSLTATVQVSDLDLANADGQRELARRTAEAIREVCPEDGFIAVSRAITGAARRACAQSVRASVREQLAERDGRTVARR